MRDTIASSAPLRLDTWIGGDLVLIVQMGQGYVTAEDRCLINLNTVSRCFESVRFMAWLGDVRSFPHSAARLLISERNAAHKHS